jgi:hypothetical protein
MSAGQRTKAGGQTTAYLRKFISENSLSLALVTLFVCCGVAQAATGWRAYDDARETAHLGPIALGPYLGTGHFLDGIFSNWQAAILQLAVLVAFSSVLRQRGAAHSRKVSPVSHGQVSLKLRPRETIGSWLYANSLSLALISLFLMCFVLHALFGAWKLSEEQALRSLPRITLGCYLKTASFWSSVLECWEAEFGAIAIYIVASIYLRQESSPESKHVQSRNQDTGDTNE